MGFKLYEAIVAIIKFMISGDGRIVAHCVHDAHDAFAFYERSEGGAVNGIAAIKQECIRIAGPVAVDDSCKPCKAEFTVALDSTALACMSFV